MNQSTHQKLLASEQIRYSTLWMLRRQLDKLVVALIYHRRHKDKRLRNVNVKLENFAASRIFIMVL